MQPALQICLGSMAVNSAHWPVGPLCRIPPVCLLIAETKCPMSTSLLRGTSYAYFDTTTSNHNWCGRCCCHLLLLFVRSRLAGWLAGTQLLHSSIETRLPDGPQFGLSQACTCTKLP